MARPRTAVELQHIIYLDAYEKLSTEWLLVCDVDEFVSGQTSIKNVLASVPESWPYFRLPVAEAVWGPEDELGSEFGCTYFRTREPKGLGKLQSLILHGRYYQYTKAGLIGHAMGKYFIRRNSAFKEPGIHFPRGASCKRSHWSTELTTVDPLWVYHFDAISFLRWKKKWKGRIDNTRPSMVGRNLATRRYMEQFSLAEAAKTELKFFAKLHQISTWQVIALRTMRRLKRVDLNINKTH